MEAPGRRCAIIATSPPGLEQLRYDASPECAELNYDAQLMWLLGQGFPVATLTSEALKSSGWEVEILVSNCSSLSRQWAAESNVRYSSERAVLIEQLKAMRPDVAFFLDSAQLSTELAQAVRPLVGRIALRSDLAPPAAADLSAADLIVSASATRVHELREHGYPAYYLPHGATESAEPVEKSPTVRSPSPVNILVDFHEADQATREVVETLVTHTHAAVIGNGSEYLDPKSLTAQRHVGPSWQPEQTTAATTIVYRTPSDPDVAHHGLFQAAASESFVLINHEPSLAYLYELGSEVISYRTPDECISLFAYFEQRPEAARTISAAGRAKTLKSHGIQSLGATLDAYLSHTLENRAYRDSIAPYVRAGRTPPADAPPIERLRPTQTVKVIAEIGDALGDLSEWLEAFVTEPGQLRPAYLQWHERLPQGVTRDLLAKLMIRRPEEILELRARFNEGVKRLHPQLNQLLAWLAEQHETHIPSYSLTSENREELKDLLHLLTQSPPEQTEAYFAELESDAAIVDFIRTASDEELGALEPTPRYARHLLWYTLTRLSKPRDVLLIGRGDYLVSCAIKVALQRNLTEGYHGTLSQVGPGCSPGSIGDRFLKRHSRVVNEDLGHGLQRVQNIDLLVFTAAATTEDELNLYKHLWGKLSPHAWLASENLQDSTGLSALARSQELRLHSWTERPASHFVQGTTVGITQRKGDS
ncbi:MAG: glycosyltransferase [Myxococcota bacterium]|nr:glycosyltransferase [Myxococcota bacterium]